MDLIDIFLKAAMDKRSIYKVFSFIGMAKNVGKTTTYNYIIKHIPSNLTLGLTSVGRDGEKKDILTQLPKPKIPVLAGNVVATAEECLIRSNFRKRILATTNITSALGKIIILEVLAKGYIELSGPSMVNDLGKVCNLLKELGANLVLIDGAFDRKSFASPLIAQATILATGAALSHDMDEVVDQTRYTIQNLSIPALSDNNAKKQILQFYEIHRAGLMEEDYSIKKFHVTTALNATSKIIESISSSTRYILIKGIVSTDLIEQLVKRNINISNLTILAEDGTKIFVPPVLLTQFYNKGGSVRVLRPIHILAVTANPVSPYGFRFNQKEFLKRLREHLEVPVFDVVGGG